MTILSVNMMMELSLHTIMGVQGVEVGAQEAAHGRPNDQDE